MKVDFTDTETAFAYMSDKKLKKVYRLFKMMSQSWLVNIGSPVIVTALHLRLPFVEKIVRNTLFDHFCGGTSLKDSNHTIDILYKYGVLTALDYGTERRTSEKDYNEVKAELLRAVDFAAEKGKSVPIIAVKLTALTHREILRKLTAGEKLSDEEEQSRQIFLERVDEICGCASEKKVTVFIDAEESWIQDAIDEVAIAMNKKYNRDEITVYNTYQMYRKGMLDNLKADYIKAREEGYILGAKVVRGAYLDQERARAEKMGYESPINPDKAATDKMFNDSMKYCIKNYKTLASSCSTHNRRSAKLYTGLIDELGIPYNHPHLNLAQLYGMSDAISFNAAQAGFNVAKYLPYGKVREVIPYLVRRAQENTSVTGDMGRELGTIYKEMQRRGLV